MSTEACEAADTEARKVRGERVRRRRREMKLTQEALARLVGVSQPSLHQWEVGETQPTFDNRRRLAAALGFDPYAIEIEAVA